MNFLQKILNEMPTDLSDLEKARYLYLKLADYLAFSTKFNNTDTSEHFSMYMKELNISKFDRNQVICKEWAQLYSYLLNSVGIKNEIISEWHTYINFTCDGLIWVADATYGNYTDLAKIKYGEDTANFGVDANQGTSKHKNIIAYYHPKMSELEEIDKKFSFYNDRKELLKKKKEIMKSYKNSKINIYYKMQLFFEIIGRLKDGYYEAKEYVKSLEYHMFTSDELSHIKGIELKRTNKDKEVDIVQCIFYKNGDEACYYILSPEKEVKRLEPEEIAKLGSYGYSTHDKKIPGVTIKSTFDLGKYSKRKLKLVRTRMKCILPYDEVQLKRIN